MSSMKTNLKFVMGSSRVAKPANKLGSGNSDFQSTINISTNSKVKDKIMSKRNVDMLKSKGNIKELSTNVLLGSTTGFNVSMGSSTTITPNFLRKDKMESKEKAYAESQMKNPMDVSLKVMLRENSKENNYGSNNSNRSSRNGIVKAEKIKSKHQKHASEIPQSFKNLNHMNQMTEGNTSQYFNNTTSNNFFENYSQPNREHSQGDNRSNLNPKLLVKTKSQALMKTQRDGSVNSIRGKGTSNTTEVEYTDDTNNRPSNGHIVSSCNNCRDLKYNVLLSNYKEQEANQKEMLKTIDILKSYIRANQNVSEKKKVEIADKFNKKNQEIKALKVYTIKL